MADRRKQPEPVQPGDEQIAREEIEGYYVQRLDQARAELEKAQSAFDRTAAEVSTRLAAFHDGERLPDLDVWSVELHAGGVDQFHDAFFKGQFVDHDAYERAKARRAATSRWLRHQGYPELKGGRH